MWPRRPEQATSVGHSPRPTPRTRRPLHDREAKPGANPPPQAPRRNRREAKARSRAARREAENLEERRERSRQELDDLMLEESSLVMLTPEDVIDAADKFTYAKSAGISGISPYLVRQAVRSNPRSLSSTFSLLALRATRGDFLGFVGEVFAGAPLLGLYKTEQQSDKKIRPIVLPDPDRNLMVSSASQGFTARLGT